jgi:hypothetical protein
VQSPAIERAFTALLAASSNSRNTKNSHRNGYIESKRVWGKNEMYATRTALHNKNKNVKEENEAIERGGPT